ncbi:hypothetical protein AMAG_11122 [Allomyces macrogynus ATCC 38327]|uniref:histone acetyltransferase n=1 Tax=Allomyces macrogynus (strain ATCC 38327) TaxID=578462 RepID=A0A0L0ST48_ALLM3|nr:hypothetical protein AMAG_11122 [Allomyces macrogynus ATCC 38327]|eukprot:KNE65504.1 hypothetical protein AMAG_11122 [Allomyces macrogynus ATCC 38327]
MTSHAPRSPPAHAHAAATPPPLPLAAPALMHPLATPMPTHHDPNTASPLSTTGATPTPRLRTGGTGIPASQVHVGCKLPAFMVSEQAWRRAEVLSVRHADKGDQFVELYVHYVDYNKRLDEWVPVTRLDLTAVEFPRPRKAKATGTGAKGKGATPAKGGRVANKGGAATNKGGAATRSAGGSVKRKASAMDVDTPVPTVRRSVAPKGGRSTPTPLGNLDSDSDSDAASSLPAHEAMDEDSHVVTLTPDRGGMPHAREGTVDSHALHDDGMSVTTADPTVAGDSQPLGGFSKSAEREKLRTGGSMTQCVSEISRVKNLNRIQMGRHLVETWYFSPYPAEHAHVPILYVCEFCLSYFGSAASYARHRHKCTLTHPPGNEIYRKDNLSFFEIDGRKQKTYCRNLCLLSKCFLDHKTLFYDVDPFLFYLMTVTDASGSHLVGYFSKEKESAEGYNLACILTLPQHQRKGYGRLLIQFSYELSKIEKRVGSPEKPLSDLGLLGYRAYWTEVMVEYLLANAETTLDELSQATAITIGDIQHTLHALGALRYYKGQHVICLSDKVIETHERNRAKARVNIDPACLDWKPPVLSAKERYLN